MSRDCVIVVVRTEAADLEARTSEGTDGGLSTRTSGAGAGTTSSAELDVEGGDATGLGLLSNILGGEHGGIGGGLITVSLHLHTTGGLGNGLATREVGDVDVGVVEGGIDVGNAEHVVVLLSLGSLGLRRGEHSRNMTRKV